MTGGEAADGLIELDGDVLAGPPGHRRGLAVLEVIEREGLMEKKGFPESYDLPALLRFLSDIKAGRRPVRAPVYSSLCRAIASITLRPWPSICSTRSRRRC